MQLKIATDPVALGLALAPFVDLVGPDRWRRRLEQLQAQAVASTYQDKVVADHHWFEMTLETARCSLDRSGGLSLGTVAPRTMATLMFAAGTVSLHSHLSPPGKSQLVGRLRDALKSGFGPLGLEIDLALQLAGEGYDVDVPDLEGRGQADLRVQRGDVEAEIECKSLSVDAGRSVHRRDFYRFIARLNSALETHALAGAQEVVLVTLQHRLPADDASHQQLEAACLALLRDRTRNFERGAFYTVKRESYRARLGRRILIDPDALYARCRRVFGPHCHVSGPQGTDRAALLVMRSHVPDDTSKPLLEALKKAGTQFTGNRPGIVAIQFEDLEPQQLLSPSLRRRSGILANAAFHSLRGQSVAGCYFTAFGGLTSIGGRLGTAGFAFANPLWPQPTETLPLLGGRPTSELAQLLGVDPATVDADDHLYGLG